MANLTEHELAELGLGAYGTDVRIDHRAAFFNAGAVHLGSHVRIDAFTVIAGGAASVRLGDFVHIGAACYLSAGEGGIEADDFVTLAPRVAVHGTSDDYLGGSLTGGIVPHELCDTTSATIRFGRHVIVGSGSIVLPGADLGDGVAVGALSVVKSPVPSLAVVAGSPARQVRTREGSRFAELERRAWELAGGVPRARA